MQNAVIEIPASQMDFDPRNPRLFPEALEDSRPEQLQQIWRTGDVVAIVRDMLQGHYAAPAPLLGIRQDDSERITVVDGAQRLTALSVAHSREAWGQAPSSNMLRNLKPMEGDPTHPLVVVESWLEAHRLRIRRHQANHSQWNWRSTAMDAKRLMEEGMTFEEAVAVYSSKPNHTWRHHIARILTALGIWEKLNHNRDHAWNMAAHFTRLAKALEYDNIRQSLGLGELQSPQPLGAKSQELARTLMTQLNGSPTGAEYVGAAVHSDNGIQLLNEVYGDEQALEQLKRFPSTDVRALCNRMNHHTDMWEVKRHLESLQYNANQVMTKIKEEQPSTLTDMTQVNVAHASFTLLSDGSAQYTVHLKTRRNREYPEIAQRLQEILHQSGHPDTLVEPDWMR